MITSIVAILFLATFIEGFVEYIFSPLPVAKPYLMYVALFFGIVFCVAYKVDVPSMVGLTTTYGWVNWVFSGLIIGRGSNYVNDVLQKFKGQPNL